MIQSMTAYSESTLAVEDCIIRWELRSLNHRYLDLFFKLPEGLKETESVLRKMAFKTLSRGKIDCSLQLERKEKSKGAFNLDLNLANQFMAMSNQLQTLFPKLNALNTSDVLKWPGMVKSFEINVSDFIPAIQTSFEQALKMLIQNRQEEGQSLASFLLARLNLMEGCLKKISTQFPTVEARTKEKMLEKLKSLQAANIEVDSRRFEEELVYLLNKMDVMEEWERLQHHINAARQLLTASTGPCGKQLDFLFQEMNREANTLTAKVNEVALIHEGLELKVLIEQAREQVQNLE